MISMTSLLKSNNGENAAMLSATVESADSVSFGTSTDTIFITSYDKSTVLKYADMLLRSIDILYGKPIIKCKIETNFTACIYIEERGRA